MVEGPSQETDRAEKLKQWIHQQDEEIKARYREEIEIEPSPILLAGVVRSRCRAIRASYSLCRAAHASCVYK
ncbi:hypothetical protein CHARACLAT_027676 [Characodon lateralis]|uniref:Uncharacterized protein n=1 Tax=Characodon lateralis TaxID=208331 RepID=A0ABU7F720_9TELE|nr:hypothetical protein [Characodon lateralis]